MDIHRLRIDGQYDCPCHDERRLLVAGFPIRSIRAKAPYFRLWALVCSSLSMHYLNALTIGSSMRRATDKQGISREFLSYVVDSTAAPVCIILPFST